MEEKRRSVGKEMGLREGLCLRWERLELVSVLMGRNSDKEKGYSLCEVPAKTEQHRVQNRGGGTGLE